MCLERVGAFFCFIVFVNACFYHMIDKVKFGEVVYEPPSITALPRKAVKEESVPRVG